MAYTVLFNLEANDQVSKTLRKIRKQSERADDSANSMLDHYQKMGASIDDVANDIREMRKEQKKVAKEAGEGSDEFKRLEKQISNAEEALNKMGGTKSLRSIYGDIQRINKELKETRNPVRQKQLANDLTKARAAAKELRTSTEPMGLRQRMGSTISSLPGGESLMGMMNPAGAMLAAGTAAAAFGVSTAKAGEEVRQLQHRVEQLTGATGKVAERAATDISGISRTFEAEQDEILKAANVLVNTYEIELPQALKMVEQGFLAGANANGDMLEQVTEYSTQFREAGFAAEDMFSVITQGVKTGIFDDKAADAVKEFGLRFREMTPAAAEALQKAFGPAMAESITKMDTKDALQAVSKKIAEMQPGQARQSLIADLFGGPGEDAGKEFFAMMGGGLKDMQALVKEGGALARQKERELALQKELKAEQLAIGQAMGGTVDGIKLLKLEAQILLTKIFGGILKHVMNIKNTFMEAVGGAENLKTVMEAVGDVFSFLWEAVGQFVEFQVKALGKILSVIIDSIDATTDLLKKAGIMDGPTSEEREQMSAQREQAKQKTQAQMDAVIKRVQNGTASEEDRQLVAQSMRAAGATQQEIQAFLASGDRSILEAVTGRAMSSLGAYGEDGAPKVPGTTGGTQTPTLPGGGGVNASAVQQLGAVTGDSRVAKQLIVNIGNLVGELNYGRPGSMQSDTEVVRDVSQGLTKAVNDYERRG